MQHAAVGGDCLGCLGQHPVRCPAADRDVFQRRWVVVSRHEYNPGSDGSPGDQRCQYPARAIRVRGASRGAEPIRQAERTAIDFVQRADNGVAATRGHIDDVGHRECATSGGNSAAYTGGRVFDGYAVFRLHAEGGGGREIWLGMGLAVSHLVAGDHDVERPGRQCTDDCIGETAPAHRHQRARNLLLAQCNQQGPGTRSPRHLVAYSLDYPVEESVDDLVDGQVDSAPIA